MSKTTVAVFSLASLVCVLAVVRRLSSPGQDVGAMSSGAWARLADEGRRIGPVEAPVVIVVFETYACGFCAQFAKSLDSVLDRRPDIVAVVPRAFDVSGRREHLEWLVMGECAADQAHLASYRRRMFADSDLRGRRGGWLAIAREVGMPELSKFFSCVQTQRHLARVRHDTRRGIEMGIDRTPTWFVNGVRFVGAVSARIVDSLVDVALHARS